MQARRCHIEQEVPGWCIGHFGQQEGYVLQADTARCRVGAALAVAGQEVGQASGALVCEICEEAARPTGVEGGMWPWRQGGTHILTQALQQLGIADAQRLWGGDRGKLPR